MSSTKSFRRRSSQYSLFPICPPAQSQPIVETTNASSSDINIIPNRSSASDGKSKDILTKADWKENRRHSTEGKRISTDLTILRVIKKLKQQSANMSRLIPLKLEASAAIPRMSSPALTNALLERRISSPSTSPIYPAERPRIPLRTSSIRRERPQPITDLTILPYTQEEWRKIMEEVKNLYAKGQYKHCSLRCKHIIKGIKDPYRVHPLYSIYLSFFAASSLEITASSLHHYSSSKLPLYQEALSYYQKAESYIEYASFSTDPTVIPTSSRHSYAHPPRQAGFNPNRMTHHSSNSSMSSTDSVRSSTESIFSHRSSSACSIASSFTSPTEQDSTTTHPLLRRTSSLSSRSSMESCRAGHKKKKVSFSFPPALPTMLSENDAAPETIDATLLIDSFPNPPISPPISSPFATTFQTQSPVHARYRFHLADLSAQLAYHIASIHTSITELSSLRAPHRSASGDLTLALLSGEIRSSSSPRDTEERHPRDKQILDIQARIVKLRENGFQRKRFDPTRYQNLCDRALDEVAENECF